MPKKGLLLGMGMGMHMQLMLMLMPMPAAIGVFQASPLMTLRTSCLVALQESTGEVRPGLRRSVFQYVEGARYSW